MCLAAVVTCSQMNLDVFQRCSFVVFPFPHPVRSHWVKVQDGVTFFAIRSMMWKLQLAIGLLHSDIIFQERTLKELHYSLNFF